MRVLSLFDGVSCGRVALERAEIPIEVYYASEIDKYAIQITQKNYPDTIQLGDINNIDFSQFTGKIDLIMGGSPCQDLSIAGKRKGLAGDRSGLFYKFVEAIEIIKPKYYLLENNVGMPQDAYEEISKLMGCYPIEINSAKLSAQNRKRFYWFNWGHKQVNLFGFPTCDIPQPEDKGILLKDVLGSGLSYQNKSNCLTASYQGALFEHDYLRNQKTMVAEPIGLGKFNGDKIEPLDKARTLTSYYSTGQTLEHTLEKNIHSMVAEPICVNSLSGRADGLAKQPSCADRIYDVNGKSVALASGWKPNITEPIRVGQIGKGGQAQRVFSIRGKSISLLANGGGQGGKTGLYKIDLPDGDYIVRKLTPVECERLQTLPDNFTEYGTEGKISNTQRYKAIGNGWTVDVIAYIFSFLASE